MAHCPRQAGPAATSSRVRENGCDDRRNSQQVRAIERAPIPDARGPYTPMARPRRSPKKLRVAKSPRTARAGPRAPTRKLAATEGKTGRPALRTYDATTARQLGAARKGLGAGRGGEDPGSRTRAADRVHDRFGHSAAHGADAGGQGTGGARETSACPASSRSPAACSRRCTAAGSGRCASSPASARRRTPTSASSTSSPRA